VPRIFHVTNVGNSGGGHSVGELAVVADGDGRLRSQTTLAVYTHATGQVRGVALHAVDAYQRTGSNKTARVTSSGGPHAPDG
jgi:hypothetical protein